ncbi:hypothetical protein [Anaeroselena agilis]|uniref:Uncharacterized protein n=1 Tax=Anaeroselena agilis TaxID=3063788 RepID=A0ABU3NYG0_9FIRM|nr:hypothetical protein [Selenomonadales bacterium 4137-cl]
MNLKELMADDVDDVFLDGDENAEEHDIDGRMILCSFDQDKSTGSQTDGVYVRRRRLSVGTVALGYWPVPEQKMIIDGEPWYVVDCVDDSGMLEVTLEANQA